jgi:Tol biopolymer transport system component/DNA-binding winged helix-turn-helix (wHTH) protein
LYDAVHPERIVRFGTFELDLEGEELRRNGLKLKLAGQPFQVLAILLERPGRIVTREELRNRLWADTFVDFDHNLNNAINKIREVLGDSAENPRFVETLPRRGYRFIGLASSPSTNGTAVSLAAGEPVPPANTETMAAQIPAVAPDSVKARRAWTLVRGAAATVLVLLGACYWYLSRPRPPPRISKYIQITHDGRQKFPVATDGARLYLSLYNQPEQWAQVPVSGGNITLFPLPLPNPEIRDVSPDGASLLVTSSDNDWQSVWTVQSQGGALRRLWDGSGVISAKWPYGDEEISWSPDGSRIRFTRDYKLWEVSSTSSGLRPLFPHWRPTEQQMSGRWTHDGRYFVFVSRTPVLTNRFGTPPPGQLWALDERRSFLRAPPTEPLQLTSGPIRWGWPIPSRDGKEIFSRGMTLRGELIRFEAKSRELEPYLSGISAEWTDFSPDGKFVLYVTFPEGILWKANRDGSNPTQLTDSPLYAIAPHWSPDGRQIVFYSPDSEGRRRFKIFILPSQGGRPQLLFPSDNRIERNPNWSPDDLRMVFDTAGTTGISSFSIHILDLSNNQVTELPGSQGRWSPRWSPDGRYIAALVDNDAGLAVFDFKTQKWSPKIEKGEVSVHVFSNDGKYIYFLRANRFLPSFRSPS